MKKFLVAALVLLALTAFAAGFASAQQHSAPAAQPAAAQEAQHQRAVEQQEERSQGTSQELTEASREAAGEENAEFKESASVRFLGRITGLSPKSAYWLAIVLNFVIVAAAIAWFLRSRLPGFFRNRTASIQQQIEEARRASEDAQRRLSDVQARLSRLDQEIAALHADAEKEGRAGEERIRSAAEEDRAKIVETARAEIEAARRQAQGSLKAYAAELAVGLAAQRMSVDDATDRQLVHSFAEELREERK